MFGVFSSKKTAKRFFLQNIGMRWLQSFWGPEVANIGPLDGPLSIDLEVPFFRLKLGRTSALTMLSFT